MCMSSKRRSGDGLKGVAERSLRAGYGDMTPDLLHAALQLRLLVGSCGRRYATVVKMREGAALIGNGTASRHSAQLSARG